MNIRIVNPEVADGEKISKLEEKVWGKEHAISKGTAEERIKLFKEGSFVAKIDDRVIGTITTIRINFPNFSRENLRKANKTWYDYTGNGDLSKVYDKNGNVLFGVSLTVDNEFSGKGFGTKLMLKVADYAIKNNIKAVFLGGRLPYYYKKKDLKIDEYLNLKNDKGEFFDPELRFYARGSLKILGPVKNYYKDPESLDYGIILLWENPMYFIKTIPLLGNIISRLFTKIFAIIISR